MRLRGKKALVTGGGAGMGSAIVRAFVAEGADVFTNDIDQGRLDALATSLGEDAPRVSSGVYDLGLESDVRRLATDAQAVMGTVDIIVNNAGIFDYGVPATEMPLETWDKLFFVNVTSHLILAQELLPAMVERGSGAVVSISSAAGLLGGGGGVAYTASKHAVLGLAKQLAFEYGPKGIRVNAICPGFVDTPLLTAARNAGAEQAMTGFAAMTASRRLGRPEEIASAAVFLASDDASFMFGSVVSVDGGYTLF